jgi:preprotein translocase subunit YajC
VVPISTQLLVLAQAQGQPDPNSMGAFVYALPFYWMVLRPQRRQEQTHRDMLKNLKENDRVVTIGGIHGIVTNVQREAERVTIRVDEATGAKLKVGLSAIARVITGENGEGGTRRTQILEVSRR